MRSPKLFTRGAGWLFAISVLIAVSAELLSAQNPRFLEVVQKRVGKEFGTKQRPHFRLNDICDIDSDSLARRVFWEYGSIFVADHDVRLPDKCVFTSASYVQRFQDGLEKRKEIIGSVEIELQDAAMDHLIKAVRDAARLRLTITPLDGTIAGSRSYEDTVRLWNSRFYRALDHWSARGRIETQEARSARDLPIDQQVKRVVDWEAQGLFFSTNFSKSIFYSVAPPGTSQHLSLLAFDVVEAGDPRVRAILNKHGWFQTIRTDKPHFTFLGIEASELPDRGLRNIYFEEDSFWVPSVDPVGVTEIQR